MLLGVWKEGKYVSVNLMLDVQTGHTPGKARIKMVLSTMVLRNLRYASRNSVSKGLRGRQKCDQIYITMDQAKNT